MSRRISRKVALQVLYSDEFHSASSVKNKKQILKKIVKKEDEDQVDPQFVLNILEGIEENKQQIDDLIKKHADNWKHERISLVDLNIMRMCIFEMLFNPEVPDKASLNEALELAKKFGEKKSVVFVNGILDRIFKTKISDS